MSATSKANRYGQQGGGWIPDLIDGQLPFGVVNGIRQTCPTPVFVRCFCGNFWVTPNTAAKPCDRCGEPFVPIVVEPRTA